MKRYANVQQMLEDFDPEFAEEFRAWMLVRDVVDAAHDALAHVEELREAWATGALDERDTHSGERSNRNVAVEVGLRNALDAIGIERRARVVPQKRPTLKGDTDTTATTDDGLRRVKTQQTTGTITARYTPQKPRVPKGEDSTT